MELERDIQSQFRRAILSAKDAAQALDQEEYSILGLAPLMWEVLQKLRLFRCYCTGKRDDMSSLRRGNELDTDMGGLIELVQEIQKQVQNGSTEASVDDVKHLVTILSDVCEATSHGAAMFAEINTLCQEEVAEAPRANPDFSKVCHQLHQVGSAAQVVLKAFPDEEGEATFMARVASSTILELVEDMITQHQSWKVQHGSAMEQ